MLGCLFLFATIVFSVGVLGASSSASTVRSVGIKSMCSADLFAWTGAIHKFQSGVLVLDQTNHRIVVVDNDGTAKNQFGGIGQGRGDLLFPEALATDSHGRIYVVDHGSSFIQVLNVDGQPITRFPIDTFVDSVTVNSSGHILANTPRKGRIVTAYSIDGSEIIRFGALMPLDVAYPDQDNEGNTEHWAVPLRENMRAEGEPDRRGCVQSSLRPGVGVKTSGWNLTAYATGSTSTALQPGVCSRLVRLRKPPWASAICRARTRPMPLPWGLVVKKGTNRLAVLARPFPSSST